MATNSQPIQTDPVVAKLLDKVPADMRGSFSEEQLLAVFLTFSALVGILVLYLIKSALGIDLIPGFSWGVWDWFRAEVLR